MVLEAITLGVIGAAYVTGDAERKQKMRKIGSDFVDVAKTTAADTVPDPQRLPSGPDAPECIPETAGQRPVPSPGLSPFSFSTT